MKTYLSPQSLNADEPGRLRIKELTKSNLQMERKDFIKTGSLKMTSVKFG